MDKENTHKEQRHPVDIHVGRRLRQRRHSLSLTQEKLAGILGLTFQQIQKYENGSNRISASRLYEVAQALKAPITFFFEGLGGFSSNFAKVESGIVKEDQAPYQAKPPSSEQELKELIAFYHQIRDPRMKHQLVNMAKILAESQKEPS